MIRILSNIKEIVTVGSIIVAIVTTMGWNNQKKEAERYRQNLYSHTVQWKDEEGRLIKEVSELRYTHKELKAVASMDSARLNKAQKDLLQANKTIESLNIKLKDAESYYKGELEVKYDSLISTLSKDSTGQITAIKPIKTPHLEVTFEVHGDTVKLNHIYRTNIETVVNRKEDPLTKHGNKRIFIARWIRPRYNYWATTKVEDPKAVINNAVYINFE